MRLAIAASRQALAQGDEPFGATLVDPDGTILLVAQNNQNSSADCTGHAEMVLLRRAQQELGPKALRGTTVYASGEPCAMCAAAMYWAEVGHVVYAASQPQMEAALGGRILPARAADLLHAARPPLKVTGGLLAEEACAVYGSAPAKSELT